MAWECLAWEQFENFMRIMWKEYKCKADYTTTSRRAKRNYSFEYVWVQHKDVVYFRGLDDTVKYLKNWWKFSKLFLWKIGFHDIDNIYDIYLSYDKKEDLVFPIFISDLVFYYFTNKDWDKNFVFSSPEYYLYLKKKYWFVDLETFEIIKHIDSEWKQIEKVLRILEKIIL